LEVSNEKLISLIFLILFTFVIAGCSYNERPITVRSGLSGDAENIEYSQPQAGQLTASEWSDLKNYEFFLSLFKGTQESGEGIFTKSFNKGYFDTLNMVTVQVKNNDLYIGGASVELADEFGRTIYKAITNLNGYAYLFPQTKDLDSISKIIIHHKDKVISNQYRYSLDNNTLIMNINSENNHEPVIEIMFVVDTTGSMGDEISYLKSEIDYVINEVKTSNENTTINLALLFYRDKGDSYITKYFDFTTNIEEQRENLAKQEAAGGGDYEEAVDIALDEAVSKNWSNKNTTKLLFHVLDAPPHYNQEDMTRFFNAICVASEKGIRMIPVASSGVNKYTEYLLRNEAMMTGGTYVFLTNDSGIGEDHIEASVGETEVEYLNHLLVRLINEYHTGVEGEKIPYYSIEE